MYNQLKLEFSFAIPSNQLHILQMSIVSDNRTREVGLQPRRISLFWIGFVATAQNITVLDWLCCNRIITHIHTYSNHNYIVEK